MLTFVQGDLLKADAEALVNTVNTVGVMGKGIALQISRAFPEIVAPYQSACKTGELTVGRVLTTPLPILDGPRYIIHFPTKQHWKGDSRIEFIDSGLKALVDEVRRLGVRSVALPPLGCGLGGLDWSEVRSSIEAFLGSLEDVDVIVFEPIGPPPARSMATATKKPGMTAGRAVLIGMMKRYLAPLMEDVVTLLEIHKLMYFLREAGEVDDLAFVKGYYGPYSTNLRHVLTKIEGHFTTGFGDASEQPGKPITLLNGAAKEAEGFLVKKPKTRKAFDRVAALIDGFETAYGLELLASVHWVGRYEAIPARSVDEATSLVHSWNERKHHTFPREHIRTAWNRLVELGWI